MTMEKIADLLRRLAGGDEVALGVDTVGELLSILAKIADAGAVDLRGLPALTATEQALARLLAAAKAGSFALELTVGPRGEVHARAAGFADEVYIRSDLPRRRSGAFGYGRRSGGFTCPISKEGRSAIGRVSRTTMTMAHAASGLVVAKGRRARLKRRKERPTAGLKSKTVRRLEQLDSGDVAVRRVRGSDS